MFRCCKMTSTISNDTFWKGSQVWWFPLESVDNSVEWAFPNHISQQELTYLKKKSNLSGPWTLHTRGLILSLKSYLYEQKVISFLPSIIPYWLWFYCDWWWATSHSICSHHSLLAHTSPHPPTYLHPQLWMNASKVSLRIFYLYSIEITQSAKNFLYEETVWTAHSSFKNLYF